MRGSRVSQPLSPEDFAGRSLGLLPSLTHEGFVEPVQFREPPPHVGDQWLQQDAPAGLPYPDPLALETEVFWKAHSLTAAAPE